MERSLRTTLAGLLFSLFLVVASFEAPVASAQVPTGTPTFGSFSGGPDVIYLGNLNAHWSYPITHKPGRGMGFNYGLSYESSVWAPVTSGSTTSWQPVANWGWVNATQAASGSTSITQQFTDYCSFPGGQQQPGLYYLENWTYNDPFGATHPFSGTAIVPTGACPDTGQGQGFSSTTWDGSGYTLSVVVTGTNSFTYTITADNGGVVSTPSNSSTGAGQSQDRNGNLITVSSNGVFTDTLGKTALTMAGSGTPSSPTTYSYTAPSGASAVYTVRYTSYSIQTNFHCSNIGEFGTNGTTTANLVSEIDLPDYNSTTNPNARYTFQYEATPSHSGFVTGRLASVTLPTGGTISYQYSGGGTGVNGITCADGSAATLKRYTPDTGSNSWTYARTQVLGSHWQTKITSPAGDDTVIDFQQDGLVTNPPTSFPRNFFETQRVAYQGASGGTVLQTTITCYNGNTTSCTTTSVSSPITQRNVTRQFGSSGLQALNVFKYPTNYPMSASEEDDYDYASGTPTNVLRKTFTTYASLGNGIMGMPSTVTICTGSGSDSACNSAGTKVAQTTYGYDQTSVTTTSGTPQHNSVTGSRGNATTISYLTQGSNTISKTFTYYDTGTVNTATDVNGATTTYNYGTGSCGNSFPTSINEPLSLSVSYTWDTNCTAGVMPQVTDENGNNVTTSYTDPYYWRPASTTDQTGIVTNFCYGRLNNSTGTCTLNPTQVESTLNFNSNNSTVDTLTTFDGLGRPHIQQKRQSPTATTFDSVETDYDSLGRVSRVTLPYSGTQGQTCPSGPSCPSTTTAYDPLSRITQVADAGGGTTTYSYSNNDTLTTVGPAPSGENTKKRQLESDGLGRLTSVCEITAGTTAWPGGNCAQNSPQTGYWTGYTYDVLGDLLTVTQNAQASSGNQQTRTYTFDALGRLTSEKNPETNQVATSYTYDTGSTCTPASSGDVVKRVDAVGNTICFAYDALHRVTSVTYPSGPYASSTPAKTFVYDSATVSGAVMANVKGRLAEAYTGPSGSKTTDLGFSYSARGEVSDVYELTPHSNSSYYHVSQTYWPHGSASQLSGNIAGLPSISYGGTIGSTVGLDGEGRITQVTAGSGQNPVTGVSYNNAGLPTQVNFGSGDSDIFAYDSNTLRMTQFKFNVGTQSQYLNGVLTWNANASLSQLAITDQFNSGDTQTCNYSHDDVIRIVGANCGSAAAQTFSYDPFGNINKSGSPNSFQPTYSVATNRMTSLPGNFTPTYDANGNVTNDSNHTYSWDADGNSITIDSVGLTFDALDRTVEQNRSGTYTEVVYGPSGGKLTLMGSTGGQTLQKAFVPLPGQSTAVYTSSGLDHYRHSDWLGSARLTSTPSRTVSSTGAYAPFGETYAQSGTPDVSFTGQNQDTVSGDYDFPFREYSTEGRWPSPDPSGVGAVDATDPQSWNRYVYVRNRPLMLVDPLGLYCQWDDGTSDDPVPDGGVNPDQCDAQGGKWIPDSESNFMNGDPSGQQICVSIGGGPSSCDSTYFGTGPQPDPTYDPSNGGIYISSSPTWAAIRTFFTLPSTGHGSCLAVFSNSVQGSVGKAARSLGSFVQKYGLALASGLRGSGVTAAQAEEVVGAMAAGGQLSPAAAALATNTISGVAETATAAAPYALRFGIAGTLGLADVALFKGVADETRAALSGQCKL